MSKNLIPEDYINQIKDGLQEEADKERENNDLNKFDYGVIALKSLITSWHKVGEDWEKENESNNNF